MRNILMPIHRKRFRIEQAVAGEISIPDADGEEIGPMHREIMAELRAIRAQMGSVRVSAAASALEDSSSREAADLRSELGSDFAIVTPGVRPAGKDHGDQSRVVTPAQAIARSDSPFF